MGLIAPLKRVGRNLAYWAAGDFLSIAFGGTGATTAAGALSNLGFSGSFGTNGYVKIPVGSTTVIIEWGYVSVTTDQSVSFPLAFPTAALSVTGSCGASSTSQIVLCEIDSIVKTSFTVRPRYQNGATTGVFTSGLGFTWIAIGY